MGFQAPHDPFDARVSRFLVKGHFFVFFPTSAALFRRSMRDRFPSRAPTLMPFSSTYGFTAYVVGLYTCPFLRLLHDRSIKPIPRPRAPPLSDPSLRSLWNTRPSPSFRSFSFVARFILNNRPSWIPRAFHTMGNEDGGKKRGLGKGDM